MRRDSYLKRKYGITEAEYIEMLDDQDGVCFLCKGNFGGRFGVPHVDHCHASGQTRKLLCDRCNRGIGFLNDDPALLRAAADYIEMFRLQDAA